MTARSSDNTPAPSQEMPSATSAVLSDSPSVSTPTSADRTVPGQSKEDNASSDTAPVVSADKSDPLRTQKEIVCQTSKELLETEEIQKYPVRLAGYTSDLEQILSERGADFILQSLSLDSSDPTNLSLGRA